ncbi:hypothetical protein [Mesorhizobium cantuariense]|uniref:Uncharacterized protein n=1 Tax=Mesorhizobium cantuariense TaxID=1300275 RepID=A0ABV7MSN5_9HYPH
MRNATVAAIIYEFLFDVYRLIDAERGHNEWLPDEHGVVREAFYHSYTSCWEWSTSVLEEVGATKTLQLPHIKQDPNRSSPYSYPLMTLDECRVADFSEFETFDNYCYAMFTFYQLIDQTSGLEGELNLAVRSPRFLEAVASKDDVFLVEDIHCVKFRRDRFEEKVMTRWRDPMQRRIFRRKDGAQK